MSKKVVNCRLEDISIQKIKMFSQQKEINIAEYIRLSIDNQIMQDYLINTGGIVIELPNPQFASMATPETLEAVADAFDDLDRKLRRICPNMRVWFNTKELSRFVEERLVICPESKKRYEDIAASLSEGMAKLEEIDPSISFDQLAKTKNNSAL